MRYLSLALIVFVLLTASWLFPLHITPEDIQESRYIRAERAEVSYHVIDSSGQTLCSFFPPWVDEVDPDILQYIILAVPDGIDYTVHKHWQYHASELRSKVVFQNTIIKGNAGYFHE